MAKTLLINPPIREWARPNNPPLGLLYIASYLEGVGYETDICDLNALRFVSIEKDIYDWLAEYTQQKKYDFIGISGLISTAKVQKQIIDYLFENLDRIGRPELILGGGLATSCPEFAIGNYGESLDYIILDEGEMPMLLLTGGIDSRKIPNLIYKRNILSEPENRTEWKHNKEKTLIKDLDSLFYPDYSKVPVDIYLGNPIWGRDTGNSSSIQYDMKRSLNMVISRGCPYKCGFCAHIFFDENTRYRIRSVDNVIKEIYLLYEKYTIDFIGMVDDNATLMRKWVVEFCEKMLSTGLHEKVHWGGSARVDQVDIELLKLMRSAGCEFLGYGTESVDKTVLKNMSKHPNPEFYVQAAVEAIRNTREAGITCNCTFIVGYIGETWESLRKTAQFMKDNNVLNNMFFATPYPGADLFNKVEDKIVEKYGSIDNYILNLGDATEFRINCTEEFSDEELIYARKCAIAGEPELIDPINFKKRNGEIKASLDPFLNTDLMLATQKS